MKKIIYICVFAVIVSSLSCAVIPLAAESGSTGFRPVIRENFNELTYSETFASSTSTYALTDVLSFKPYNYTNSKVTNGALHIKKNPDSSESYATKFATLSYSGKGVDCYYAGRLGRSMHLLFEADVTPMQTDVSMLPLTVAHATSKSTQIDFVKFTDKGKIQFLSSDVGSYEAGKKYTVKVDFDLQDGVSSLWINGEATALDVSHKVQDGFKTQNIYSLRMSFDANDKPAEFYVDNIYLSQFIRPESSEVVTVGENGDYATIAEGIAGLKTTGGTVLIQKGTYEEDLTIGTSGGDFDKLDIVGEEGAVLKGTINIRTAVNVAIRNLTIDGGAVPLYTAEELAYINENRASLTSAQITAYRNRENEYKADGITIKGRGCEVTGCTIRNILGTAIGLGAPDAYIAGNTISNCAGAVVTADGAVIENNIIDTINVFGSNCGSGDVFRVFGKNIIIRNNIYKGTVSENLYRPLPGTAGDYYAHADFLQSYDNNAQESAYVLIDSNVFIGFCHQGIMLENDRYGASDGIFYIHDWVVRNNVFSGYYSWGVCGGKANGGIPNIDFYNNIFDGEHSYHGLALNGINGSGKVYNNIFIGKGLSAGGGSEIISKNNAFINTAFSGSVTDSDSLSIADAALAGFKDYQSGRSDNCDDFNDLHLLASSPLVNKGTLTDFDFDIEGNLRDFGGLPDIGPYEYTTLSKPEKVKFTYPSDSYSIRLGGSISLESEGGAEYFADGESVPALWTPEAAGIYTLKATDGVTSDEITLTVYPASSWEGASAKCDADGKIRLSAYDDINTVNVYVASYEAGVLSDVSLKTLTNAEKNTEYEIGAMPGSASAKVYIWNSSLLPVAKSVTLGRD